MPEPIHLLYEYLEYLKKIKDDASPGYISEFIRTFVRDYSDELGLDKVTEHEVFDKFRDAFPDINASKSYFKKVCNDEWITEENNGINFIVVSKEKPRKRR